MDSGIRLNKQVAQISTLSRRESDRLIQAGQVKVNGEIETNPARRVGPSDLIETQWNTDSLLSERLTICLHKPAGYVVSHNPREGSTVYELVQDAPAPVSAIGRLDKDSEGLLLLSNDSSLPRFIIGEGTHCEKEYLVEVDRPISEESLNKLGKSMTILGKKILPARVRRISSSKFNIILTEGRNRQIRRMVRKVGFEVQTLKRLRIAHIQLGALSPGQWRALTPDEIQSFKNK